MNLSVIIISFKSNHLIKKILKNIPKKYQVVIVENSRANSIKKYQKKNKNVEIIIPSENLGYAKGFNEALKKCKNKMILTLTPDVLVKKNLFLKLENILKNFKDFTLLAPEYKNQKIYKNFTPFNNERLSNIKLNKYRVTKVREIDWCFCIINRNKVKTLKLLDENYFMYFETIDLCKNLINKKHKFYIIKGLTFDHLGTSSSKEKFKNEILLNRNWHFSWSKFYFFKKNNNYFYAVRKVIPNIYQNLIGIIISLIKMNIFNAKLHLASLSGILNGMFFNKSYYRPNIK